MQISIYLSAVAFALSSSAQAADSIAGFGPPLLQKFQFGIVGLITPSSALTPGTQKVSLRQTTFNASIPVLRTEKNGVVLSARTHAVEVRPDQNELPNLYDIQFGANYTHQIEPGRMWSIGGSFGSASDKPFKRSDVNTVSGTATYTFTRNATSAWTWLVSYSNNRPILNNLPMPGFAYSIFPSRTFRATFGLPFAQLDWQFAERWNLNLFTIAPWVAKAQVAYRIAGPAKVSAGIDFSQLTYLRYGRTVKNERIYQDEKRIFLGASSPLSPTVKIELESGYAFGRKFFEAKNYRPHPPIHQDLSAEAYGKLALSAAF